MQQQLGTISPKDSMCTESVMYKHILVQFTRPCISVSEMTRGPHNQKPDNTIEACLQAMTDTIRQNTTKPVWDKTWQGEGVEEKTGDTKQDKTTQDKMGWDKTYPWRW